MNRSELREKVMIILYQVNIHQEKEIDYVLDDLIKEHIKIDNTFSNELIHGILTKQNDLNELANKYLKNWTMDRIDKTGKAILEIAIYELLHMDTPEIVVINEAVELAKKYSDDSVRKIINATLDTIIKEEDYE